MACRNAYKTKNMIKETDVAHVSISEPIVAKSVNRLLFGVDSKIQANDLLQNNIDEFEWVVRNKVYPNFYGRYINGENCLTKDEIEFIHSKGCKIAAIYADESTKQTEGEGDKLAEKICMRALELGIPEGTCIFLEIGEEENVTRDFMRGFSNSLMLGGYTPGFKANTDAKFSFDREFSIGMQNDRDIFNKCLVWAVSPTVKEYDGITTSHIIQPDNWKPYAPPGITRRDIAVWQYGKDCHPIEDDMGNNTTFNLNLVCDEHIITDKMY